MIGKNEILTLDDDKEYYVLNSLIYENNNYLLISETDTVNHKISENFEIVWNDVKGGAVEKVTDPKLLYIVTSLFEQNDFDSRQ